MCDVTISQSSTALRSGETSNRLHTIVIPCMCVCACVRVCMSALHVLEFINEAIGERFDLVNVEVWWFLPEGDTLGCVQYKEEVNGTVCSHIKHTNKQMMSIIDGIQWENNNKKCQNDPLKVKHVCLG